MHKVDLNKAALSLKDNKAFLDIMRGLFYVTAFNAWVKDGASLESLSKANGKREVWGQLKAAMDLPQEVLTQIEHYNVMKDID